MLCVPSTQNYIVIQLAQDMNRENSLKPRLFFVWSAEKGPCKKKASSRFPGKRTSAMISRRWLPDNAASLLDNTLKFLSHVNQGVGDEEGLTACVQGLMARPGSLGTFLGFVAEKSLLAFLRLKTYHGTHWCSTSEHLDAAVLWVAPPRNTLCLQPGGCLSSLPVVTQPP